MAVDSAGLSILVRPGPERRVVLYYLASMMPAGAISVHAGVWFAENGLSTDQIGLVGTVPMMVILCMNLTVGKLADRASDWRHAIRLATALQAAAAFLLLFVDSFLGILIAWTLTIVPSNAIMPVSDAATTRLTRRRGTSFGVIRACATVGYLVAVFVVGLLITHLGGDWFVPIMITVCCLKAAAAWFLPLFRSSEGPPAASPTAGVSVSRLFDAMKSWFVLPLVGFAMVFSTHMVLNLFAALLWKQQGIRSDVIGILIVIGAMAEAAVMFGWSWSLFRGRIRPEHGLLLAGVVGAFRWACMAMAPPVTVLCFLQLLHAITFGLGYLSLVQFIAERTREEIAAQAQSFYAVVQGVMNILAVYCFGVVTGWIGFHAYFVASGFALAGVATILTGLRAALRL